jgi:hypothetical protein
MSRGVAARARAAGIVATGNQVGLPSTSQNLPGLGSSLTAAGRLSLRSMLDQRNNETGVTSGDESTVATGLTPDASSGVAPSGDGRDLESRVTALEQNAPSNTLGTAKPVFSAQAQQAAAGIYGEEQVPGTFDRSLNNIEMARSAAAGSSPRAIMQGANDEKQAPSKLDPIEKTGSAAVGGISSGIGI